MTTPNPTQAAANPPPPHSRNKSVSFARNEFLLVILTAILEVILAKMYEHLKVWFGEGLALLILVSPIVILILALFIRSINQHVIERLKVEFEKLITQHGKNISASFREMISEVEAGRESTIDRLIVKHDATITPKLELLIAKHDQIFASRLGEMAKTFENKLANIQLPIAGYQDKYEKMKTKYRDVTFKDVNSTNEFTPAEA